MTHFNLNRPVKNTVLRNGAGPVTDQEMDRRIEALAERMRQEGKHTRQNVTVRRVDPATLRRSG